MLMAATLGAVMGFGLLFEPLFGSGTPLGVLTFLSLGLALMGLTYGPLGTALAGLFPTAVRYTGASLTFNLAGIVGASLAPYVATWLAVNYGSRIRRLLPQCRRPAHAGGVAVDRRPGARYALTQAAATAMSVRSGQSAAPRCPGS